MSAAHRAGRLSVALGAGLAWASLGLVLHNLRHVRVPDLDAPAPTEDLAVLLPARDEAAGVAVCVQALVRAADECPGRVRIIVLDDRSRDDTALLAARAAPGDRRVTVLTGAPTPPGWLGKPWACQQLADAAGDASLLVFVDADVHLEAHGLVATAHLLRSSGLDLVCPYPRQVARTVAERLVQPLLQWSWMSTLPLRLAERSARPSLTAANGQLLAVDAAAYARAGGHAVVRAEVLEDLALLRALKRSGGHGVVAEGSGVAACRMYDGGRALRAGYRKSLWDAAGSPTGSVLAVLVLVLAHVVPAVAALRGSRTGLLGYVAGVLGRVLVGRLTGSRVWPDALAHPVSVLALAALTADSVVAYRRGSLSWKGRPVVPGSP